jgi:glycosyltransferase involved in cell wall biosynthesis
MEKTLRGCVILMGGDKLMRLKERREKRYGKGRAYTTYRAVDSDVPDIKPPHSHNRVNKKEKSEIKLKKRQLNAIVSAPFLYNGSFGIVGRGIAEALYRNEINVGANVWKEKSIGIKLKPVIKEIINNEIERPSVEIRVSHPDSFHCIDDIEWKIGVGVTEERLIRFEDWIRGCRMVDQVWVPSNFCKKSFEDSGVDNVLVVPNGYDPEIFNSDVSAYNYGTDNFTFLHLGVRQRRKGSNLLIRAFQEEFSEDEATLVLKDCPKEFEKPEGISYLRKNIMIIHDNIPSDEMGMFYKGADAFVMPTRGEGFGIPILEAMACKIPVIVTNYSGHLDFCNNKNSFLIECDHYNSPLFDEKDDYVSASKMAVGAKPSLEHLKWTMRYIYENHKEKTIKRKVEDAYETAKGYTWKEVGKKIIDIFSSTGIYSKFEVKIE